LYGRHRTVRLKVDHPTSRLRQVSQQTDRGSLFFYTKILFIIHPVHKGLLPLRLAYRIPVFAQHIIPYSSLRKKRLPPLSKNYFFLAKKKAFRMAHAPQKKERHPQQTPFL
jgi:hypothetical protein